MKKHLTKELNVVRYLVLGGLLMPATLSLAAVVANFECKTQEDHHSEAEGDEFCAKSSCDSSPCKDPFLTAVNAGPNGAPASCSRCRPKPNTSCTLSSVSTVVDLWFRIGTCEFTNAEIPHGRGELSDIDCHCDSDNGAVAGPTTVACNCN